MIEELKPCPFCGSAPRLVDGRDVNIGYFVKCEPCALCLPASVCRDPAAAIAQWNTRHLAVLAQGQELKLEWRDGAPPHPWDKEWFIAETTFGDRVALTALPEDWAYDFKTADDTYIKCDKIKRWMQFPDSNYVAPLAEGATDRCQFASLRAANEVRQREWDVLGQLTLAYRGNELAGEVGEACNVIKKLERERLGINGSRDTVEHLAEELADVIICTDLIAMQAGIDLEGAVVAKFNASSEKVGLKTRMVRRQSPAASASELPAWEDPRVQTVYNMLCDPALDTPPNPEEHWEGWVSRNIVKALCPSQPETDAEVFMASNAALTSEVLQLRAQVERLTAALTEIEDLGVDGATGARLANIATQALSPLPFEPKKERKPKLSPQENP